jgi:hypothetical protein
MIFICLLSSPDKWHLPHSAVRQQLEVAHSFYLWKKVLPIIIFFGVTNPNIVTTVFLVNSTFVCRRLSRKQGSTVPEVLRATLIHPLYWRLLLFSFPYEQQSSLKWRKQAYQQSNVYESALHSAVTVFWVHGSLSNMPISNASPK